MEGLVELRLTDRAVDMIAKNTGCDGKSLWVQTKRSSIIRFVLDVLEIGSGMDGISNDRGACQL